MASELFMVFKKEDNVEEKITEMKSKLNQSAEELKNLGNYCMKLQNKIGAINVYKVALTKTADPTLTPKLKMVLHGNISQALNSMEDPDFS
jgi:phage shock protein A